MDASWKSWTSDNLDRGCAPQEIFEILLKNNFTEEVIREAMGERFPQAPQPAEPAAMAQRPFERALQVPGAKCIYNSKLQLVTIDHCLTDAECDGLVEIIRQHLRPSTVFAYVEGYRTSTTCDLSLLKHPLVQQIDTKLSQVLGIAESYAEGIQAQKYDVGQEFKPHTDYFKSDNREFDEAFRLGGNRTWTFMIYLNNTPKGGGTRFVNIDKTFMPEKGKAVIWNNLYEDGTCNPDTLHWGMPVEEGEKIIITKWFREKGSGPAFV